jgi:hypothetical protein
VGQAVRRGLLLGFTPFGPLSRGSKVDNVAHEVARRYPDNVAGAILARFGCETYTPVSWHWITTTESLRSPNAGVLVVAKAYFFCPAAKSRFDLSFSAAMACLILNEY